MKIALEPCLGKKELLHFLYKWDHDYSSSLKKIDLFNPLLTSQWTQAQKTYFARLFYHVRGHFHDFLWFLGNHASSKLIKDIILTNIAEEFNSSAKSHEQMYIDFASSHGADLTEEVIENKNHLPFIQEYNRGHLRWLTHQSEEERFAAFSAYERLDNIDYKYLAELASSLNTPRKGLLFFKVHLNAQHFGTTERNLSTIWGENPSYVKDSFTFIGEHQLKMWRTLSDTIFEYIE